MQPLHISELINKKVRMDSKNEDGVIKGGYISGNSLIFLVLIEDPNSTNKGSIYQRSPGELRVIS